MSCWEEDYCYLGIFEDLIGEYEQKIISLKHELWRREHKEPPTGDVWECADGSEIPMHKMTIRHIRNAIRYFEREIKYLTSD